MFNVLKSSLTARVTFHPTEGVEQDLINIFLLFSFKDSVNTAQSIEYSGDCMIYKKI